MNDLELGFLKAFASHAPARFVAPHLLWLEEINKANVLYYRWLFRACEFMHPVIAVELGVCRAEGSAHIAAGVGSQGLTIGIDIAVWEPYFGQNVEAIRGHGLEYVFIHRASTAPETVAEVKSLLTKRGAMIGLIFIDTNHTYNQAIGEFRTYEWLLAPGALIVMDDILDPPNEVYRAFQEIPGQHLEMNELHIAGSRSVGFGAVIYEK